jgi:predicted NACHT family NTPase
MPDSEDPKQVSSNDLRNSQFGGGFINAESVNAQRIGGDIWNIFLGQQITPVGNPARPKNERLLLARVKEEITVRLEQSLHHAVLINLGKELQPQKVKRPWDAEIKIGLKRFKPLPETTSILEVFDSTEIAGKLLILGAPGSGKTTTQLELAQALVKRAEEQPDYPVPVLFNLSSWKDNKQPIHDWLVTELKSKYGVQKNIGYDWVNNCQILPMLDGLDELQNSRQKPCIKAINQLVQGEYRPQYLVVCSRSEEYTNYKTRLQLNGTIYLQPLHKNQICKYLADVNHTDLWFYISNEINLLELTKIPLVLNIVILAYQEIFRNSWENVSKEQWDNMSTKEWIQTPSSNSFNLEYLLISYIQLMLKWNINSKVYIKQRLPAARQTQLWLVWLAQQLDKESQTEFFLESIQPTCLKNNRQKWIYRFVFMLNIGLSSGLIGLIFGSITFGLYSGLGVAIFFACIVTFNLISASFSNLKKYKNTQDLSGIRKDVLDFLSDILENKFNIDNPILPVGYLHWSWKKFLRAVMVSLIRGFLVWTFLVSIFQQPMTSALVFICVFILVDLSISASGIFDKPDIERQINFNQGIQQSIITAGLVAVFTCFSFVIPFWINKVWKTSIITELVLIVGLLFGVFRWQATGGLFCIQHFSLRLVLYFNGYIPWNYARFLDYCTERMLLQRVGGRYRFIHKLLQDHFAQMEFKRDSR